MPKDAIERAIQRGTGEGKEGAIETLTYEAYAPGGTALVIESLTDNRNRATNEIKIMLADHEASLAQSGSVTYLFDRMGVVRFPLASTDGVPPEMELCLIDAGASDFVHEEGVVEARCAPQDLASLADTVGRCGFTPDMIEFQWVPKTLVETDEETANHVMALIDELEAHDEVSRVFSNLA